MQNRDTEISMVILPWDQAIRLGIRLRSAYCSIYTYVGKAEKLKTSGFGFGFFEKTEPEPNVGRHPYTAHSSSFTTCGSVKKQSSNESYILIVLSRWSVFSLQYVLFPWIFTRACPRENSRKKVPAKIHVKGQYYCTVPWDLHSGWKYFYIQSVWYQGTVQ